MYRHCKRLRGLLSPSQTSPTIRLPSRLALSPLLLLSHSHFPNLFPATWVECQNCMFTITYKQSYKFYASFSSGSHNQFCTRNSLVSQHIQIINLEFNGHRLSLYNSFALISNGRPPFFHVTLSVSK